MWLKRKDLWCVKVRPKVSSHAQEIKVAMNSILRCVVVARLVQLELSDKLLESSHEGLDYEWCSSQECLVQSQLWNKAMKLAIGNQIVGLFLARRAFLNLHKTRRKSSKRRRINTYPKEG
jgi:hypothetical protein